MAGSDIQLQGPDERDFDTILTPDALEFVAALQREFGPRRRQLLAARVERRRHLAAGEETLGFLAETASVREGDWQAPHMHPSTGNLISGVYYAAVPEKPEPELDFPLSNRS